MILVLTKAQLAFLEHARHWTDLRDKGADELGGVAQGASRRSATKLEELGLVECVALGRLADADMSAASIREDFPIYRITALGREQLQREEESGPMCWRVSTGGYRAHLVHRVPGRAVRVARCGQRVRGDRRARRAKRCAGCLGHAADTKTLPLPSGAEQPRAASAQGS